MKKAPFFKYFLLLAGLSTVLCDAKATDFSWIGSGSTPWSTAANWSPSGPPTVSGTTNNVIVAPTVTGGVMALDFTGTATVENWNMSGVAFNIRPASTGTRTLDITGVLTKNGSGVSDTIRASGTNATLSMNIGSIVVNAGQLALGIAASGDGLTSLNVGDATLSGELDLRADAAQLGTVTLNLTSAKFGFFTGANGSSGGASVSGLVGSTGLVETTTSGTTSTNISGVLTINGAGSNTFSGTLQNGGGAGVTMALVKAGSGTQTLSGNGNTYSGGTTINAGTLLISNTSSSSSATGTGAVTIQTGGILGGTGFVVGAVTTVSTGATAALNGHLAPGAPGAAGTLTINNTLVVSDHAFLDFDLNMPNVTGGTGGNDLLKVLGTIGSNGDVTLGQNVVLNLTSMGANFGPGTYDLIDFTGTLTGTSNLSTWMALGLSSYTFGSDADSVFLTVGAVPEPQPLALLLGGGMLLLFFLRKCRARTL